MNNNIGHRARLIDKFNKHPESLHDYEIIELFLFLVRKRVDTKPIAKDLINTFGDIGKIFFQENEALSSIKDVGLSTIHAINLVKEIIKRALNSNTLKRTCITEMNALISYLKTTMGNNAKEYFKVIFLDSMGGIIADENYEGTANKISLYQREIIKKALYFNAVGIILTHNHPSGNASPSQEDIEFTRLMKDICRKLDIKLHDHIIVAKGEYKSMLAMGII